MSPTSPAESGAKDHREELQANTRWWTSSHWHTLAVLLIAVIAVALAVAAWLRPSHEGASGFVEQQSGDAKTNLCSAYAVVHQGVVSNTHLANPGGSDPSGQLAVAANARLALVGGGAYLRDRLAANRGSPVDLATALSALATTIEQLGVNYLAGVPNAAQDPLRHDLNSEITQLDKLCG